MNFISVAQDGTIGVTWLDRRRDIGIITNRTTRFRKTRGSRGQGTSHFPTPSPTRKRSQILACLGRRLGRVTLCTQPGSIPVRGILRLFLAGCSSSRLRESIITTKKPGPLPGSEQILLSEN